MDISKDENNLIIKIPLITQRFNPYKEMFGGDGYVSDMDNIIGVIDNNDDWEIGFAYRIDRSYKGKDDDISFIFLHYSGSKKEFGKLCEKLKIDVLESPASLNGNESG